MGPLMGQVLLDARAVAWQEEQPCFIAGPRAPGPHTLAPLSTGCMTWAGCALQALVSSFAK